MNEEDKIEAVRKVLGNPVQAELPENAQKVRRNLMSVSLIVLFVVWADIKIDPNPTVFGLKFTGITTGTLTVGLSVITAYWLLHFIWYAIDGFAEWRIRITGTRLAHQTGAKLSSQNGDYPDDPRQSSLYHWWIQQRAVMKKVLEKTKLIEDKIDETKTEVAELLDKLGGPDHQNFLHTASLIQEAKTRVTELQRTVEATKITIESNRVPVSLERFDQWFKFFLRSQNLRWLVIDIMAPIILGIMAITLLFTKAPWI